MPRKNQLLFWTNGLGSILLLTISVTASILNQQVFNHQSNWITSSKEKLHTNIDHNRTHLKYLYIVDGVVQGLRSGVQLPHQLELIIPAWAYETKVTKINQKAFFGCQAIKSVYLEEGINEIGQNAFGECTNLTTISLPNSMRKIGNFAFVNCHKLTALTIPPRIEEIGYGTLDGCHQLKSEDVVNHSTILFDWWVWNHAYPQILAEIPSIDLNEYHNDLNQPFSKIASGAFYAVNNLNEIKLSQIEEIGEHAFDDCLNLRTITIPEGIKQINHAAFCSCHSLETITIPSSVIYLGFLIFDDCINLKHDHVINLSPILFDWWVQHHRYANKTLSNMQNINLANYKNSANQAFHTIGDGAFKDCHKLNTIALNHDLIKIGTHAFRGCSNLKRLTFSSSVQDIGDYAFVDCVNLKAVKIPNGLMNLGKRAFYSCKKLNSVVLPYTITEIKAETFVNCQSLKSIKIPNGVSAIGCRAFSWCLNLKSVTLPYGLEKIDHQAFAFCRNLSELNLPESMNELGKGVFESCSSLKQITIPSRLKKMDCYCFRNCHGLKKVKFEYGLTEIADGTFWNCHSLVTISWSDSIRIIGDTAFKDCRSLKKIALPENLNAIGSHAFNGCKKLEKIILPNQVNEIGEGAFKRCANLKSINLPPNIDKIADQTFYCCHQLRKINIPDRVNEIGDWAFYNCRKLKNILLPKNLVAVSEGAFEDCRSLKAITIPAGVTSIAKNVFFNCPNLDPKQVVNYSKVLFDWWMNHQIYQREPLRKMEKVYLDDYRNSQGEPFSIIGEGAFDEVGEIRELIFPETVTCIAENNFEFSPSLEKVYLLNGTQFYADSLFVNANPKIVFALTNPQLTEQLLACSITPERLETVASDETWFINSDGELVALTTNGRKATSLTIPWNINSINQNAFKGCSQLLKQIDFSKLDTRISIPEGTFNHLFDVVYYTNNSEMVSCLIKAGACSRQIGLKRGDFFATHNNSASLLGLTDAGKEVNDWLLVPANTSYIAKQTLFGCQAKGIDFSLIASPHRLVISKDTFTNLNLTCLIKDECLLNKLVRAGVRQANIKKIHRTN